MTADEACTRAIEREALYATFKNLGIAEEDHAKWAIAYGTGRPMLAEGYSKDQLNELFKSAGLPVAAVFAVPADVENEVRTYADGVLTCTATINGEDIQLTFNLDKEKA